MIRTGTELYKRVLNIFNEIRKEYIYTLMCRTYIIYSYIHIYYNILYKYKITYNYIYISCYILYIHIII